MPNRRGLLLYIPVNGFELRLFQECVYQLNTLKVFQPVKTLSIGLVNHSTSSTSPTDEARPKLDRLAASIA